VQVGFHTTQRIERPQFAIDIHTADGVYCAGINTRMDDRDLGVIEGDGRIELVIPKLWLLPGAYTVSVGILDAQGLTPFDLHMRAYPFSVASERRDFGVVYLEHEWRHAPSVDRAVPSHPIGRRVASTAVRTAPAHLAAVQEERV
jgi:hypothetical protein